MEVAEIHRLILIMMKAAPVNFTKNNLKLMSQVVGAGHTFVAPDVPQHLCEALDSTATTYPQVSTSTFRQSVVGPKLSDAPGQEK